MAEAEVDYLIRIGEVEKQTGLGRSSIYRRIREGSFPEALNVGGGQVRWRQSEVKGWADTRERVTFGPQLASAE
ncbi:AlpA family phage regulatory protein [Pararoseomonas sp. SCSIO 73927]|uniref:helix-turn-helix transcriptional regulator n=1 Tax=Pararoseomonas sp. SCSIO 73927 TaxID=3114537 RepID=UPI0030D4E825